MRVDASTFSCPPSLWRTVAAASNRPWPPRSPEDVDAVVGALQQQRLLPLAVRDAGVPPEVRDHAARRYAGDAARLERLALEQEDGLAMLVTGLQCPWIAVNGADYRSRLYPEPILRPMSDVDILIGPGDVSGAGRWLASLGYAPMARGPSSIDRGFRRSGAEWWIDLYVEFAQRQRADIDYDEVWAGRITGADGLPRMAASHALAVHALRLANEQFVSPLRRFLDLWLLSRDEAAVRAAFETARRWRIARAVHSTFVVMRRLIPESQSDPWQREADDLVSARDRRSLERAVLRGAPYAALPSRPVQIWRKLLLLDSASHRVRFVAAQVAALPRVAGGRTFAPGDGA